MTSQPRTRIRLHHIVLPLAAFLAVLPLILQGCSCGHDFNFHLLNWMEAARQFTHGNLHLHWAFTPAYNAGEPRFVFYPPLSWTIGAILGLLMPWTWTPIAYTWLVLTAAGFALYRLAREFAAPSAALLAAAFYLVNPYTLFTAYERTAYAELLAAVWIPLLLLAILGKKVTIPRIAIPVALLWLTDAPAAVMGCYALALLTLIRLFQTPATIRSESPNVTSSRLQLALTTIAGTLLGLGLAAFYILPAAYERRFVQIAMAILPEMSIQDNFLFHHSPDLVHDAVLRTASLIALLLLALTVITLAIVILRSLSPTQKNHPSTSLLPPLTALTLAIAFLLIPLSNFIWTHLPELVFLQFPWRFLAILAAVLSLAIALLLNPFQQSPTLPQKSVISTEAKRSGETPAFTFKPALKPTLTTALALLLAATLAFSSYHLFRQTCDDEDNVTARLALFRSDIGTEPTDEYTPTTSDNDALGQTNPPFWLIPNLKNEDQRAPANAIPGLAPTHLTLNSPQPQILVLNLRSYPNWRVTLNQTPIANPIARNDGLIAFPIPAGPSQIDIAYHRTLDQTLGNTLTLLSLALLILSLRRKQPTNS